MPDSTQRRAPRRAAVLLCAALAGGLGLTACSSSSSSAVKTNGCTAITSGTSAGRVLVTYRDTTGDPSMHQAIEAAVSAWNAAASHVLLQSTTGSATVTFVAAQAATATSACSGHAKRASTITLDSAAWHGTNGKAQVTHPERDVALEIGHALGLSRGGSCSALMTSKTCGSYASGPDAAEVSKIDKMYPVP